MNMITVTSNAIHSVGYDAELKILRIEFKHGRIYDFLNVPKNVYVRFLNATSKGNFYDRYIKNRFNC